MYEHYLFFEATRLFTGLNASKAWITHNINVALETNDFEKRLDIFEKLHSRAASWETRDAKLMHNTAYQFAQAFLAQGIKGPPNHRAKAPGGRVKPKGFFRNQSASKSTKPPIRFNSKTNRWHGPDGKFIKKPTADQLRDYARSQGWQNTKTTPAGFETWTDAAGVRRMKIKPPSTQQGLGPGSTVPRATIWNESGQRVDGFGRAVTKKSPTAHAPIEW